MTGRPVLVAGIGRYAAWRLSRLLAPVLQQILDEDARCGVHPDLLAELRQTAAAIGGAGRAWEDWRRAAADGNSEGLAAEVEAGSPPWIDTDAAGALLGVSARRVRQLVESGALQGRKVAGRWQVELDSVRLRALEGARAA